MRPDEVEELEGNVRGGHARVELKEGGGEEGRRGRGGRMRSREGVCGDTGREGV